MTNIRSRHGKPVADQRTFAATWIIPGTAREFPRADG